MSNDNQYDLIERKNIANIVAKLKSGKTLTAADRKALENHKRKETGLRPVKTETELAKEFGVNRRGSIVRWKKAGAPFNGTDAELYQWLVNNNARGAAAWMKAFREANPDQYTKKAAKKKPKPTATKSAEELRDEYFIELQEAKEAGDEAREKTSLDAYLKIDKQIRDAEAHDKKLGLDRGEVLSRLEVERIIKASIWAGNACIDKFSKQIAQRLSNLPPQEVHKALKAQLTGMIIFEGMRRVTKTPGEINVPQWIADCYETERSLYLKP